MGGGGGRGQDESDTSLEEGEQVQQVIELREVFGDELFATRLSSCGSYGRARVKVRTLRHLSDRRDSKHTPTHSH